MNLDQKILNQSYQEVHAAKVCLNSEQVGSRWTVALDKAMNEIRENKSIKFTHNILSFVSRDSKETRIVTKSGCVKDACKCGDGISYHKAIFAILERYEELENKAMRVVKKEGNITAIYTRENGELTKQTERCGDVIVWQRPTRRLSLEAAA